jgi:hypothetical protein
MKKLIAMVVVAAAIGTAAFGQEEAKKEAKKPGALSAGFVLLPNFGGGIGDESEDMSYGAFGFGLYFDAKYVALNIGLDFLREKYDGVKDDDSYNYFTIGLLAKYPIAIGSSKFTIAPAVGFEYQMFMKQGDWKRSDAKDDLDGSDYTVVNQYDNFILKFGALADYTITGGLYARAGVLLDVKFAHKDGKDPYFGAEIPIAFGYRF